MRLSFHGAARGVTGSCHLLEAGGHRVLVDCGLFQGGPAQDALNRDGFGFDPATIDTLLLTHAHLDHCGRIPLLVKRGFRGEIVTTAATRDLTRLILLDAANIQEEDAVRAARRARRSGRMAEGPLFSVADALLAFDGFGRTADYGEPLVLAEGVTVRFEEAGHILGSAFLVVDIRGRGRDRRIVFSGDIGCSGRAVLRDPAPPPDADHVVMETTYGDRAHRGLDASVDELFGAIRDTVARGGNVVIPTFALERAQELLFHLGQGMRAGRLPHGLPVFLDSPMAISATGIFRRHTGCFRPEVQEMLARGADPFDLPGLQLTRSADESRRINAITGGAVILAGSGMCTGGRVLHHLKHNLWRAEASIVFVGFAVQGTLARQIIDAAPKVDIFGRDIRVAASIHTINGFSAHAGQDELLGWVGHAGRPETVYLVHGDEQGGMAAIGRLLEARGQTTLCPALHEEVALR